MGSGGILHFEHVQRNSHSFVKWNLSYIESAWIYRENEDPSKVKVRSRIPCGRWSRRLHPGCTMRLHVGLKPCHSCQAMRFRKVQWSIVKLLVTWYIMILCISDHLWRICQRCIPRLVQMDVVRRLVRVQFVAGAFGHVFFVGARHSKDIVKSSQWHTVYI
jgi:hypothetical protein